jgi:DNA polymerase III subunit delta'
MADVRHPLTTQALDNYLVRPSHALLLIGPTGMGKFTVATGLAANLLDVEPTKLVNHPYFKHIQKDKERSISIEQVRDLEQFLSRKVPGNGRRVIVVEDAHLLGIPAQNALLKTLEEPPANTMLILTAAHERALLPTIRSRVQAITIRRPAQTSVVEHFTTQGFTERDIQRAYAMSGGLPGLMQAILRDDAEHPLVQAAVIARQLAGATTFDRLCMVDALAKDREKALEVLGVLQQMARLAMRSSGNSAVWGRVLRGCHQAIGQLELSGQPKLVLTNLMLNL